MERNKISLTRLVLAMAFHEDQQTENDTQPEDTKEKTKKLVREIDFTQKGAAETKTLEV